MRFFSYKNVARVLLVTSGFSLLLALVITQGLTAFDVYTSQNQFCASCHAHPHATESWKKSSHANNSKGVVVNCVACHLPPRGNLFYYHEKIKAGLRDYWAMYAKEVNSIDWEAKHSPVYASKLVYDESCQACHQNLFPAGLSDKGVKGHLHYQQRHTEINCIRCHLSTGHYRPRFTDGPAKEVKNYQSAARLNRFEDFTETIPGTSVSFSMKAIPGGEFYMGSNDNEPFRKSDEGPVRKVILKPFFMSVNEVSWDEYMTFCNEMSIYIRKSKNSGSQDDPDAITGPTPPYGNPDHGWGMGKRPAIGMTWYAANMYCRWLSKKTGKRYRLPTEAEWEYACRAGTHTPYFFPGKPQRYSSIGWLRSIFPPDTAIINSYAVYKLNAVRTAETFAKLPNPFGLVHMAGNVAEFCSDFYHPDAYKMTDTVVYNPTGPTTGTERVVRGGSLYSDAASLRSAARDHTHTEYWLRSDPQYPKSKWWYSDCPDVGFRVVCEFDY